MKNLNRENSQHRTAMNASKLNEDAMSLVNKHYQELLSILVKTEIDRDLFNDTVLSISYKYDPSKDFKEQFIFHFNSNQARQTQEDKIRSYMFNDIPDGYDVADVADEVIEELVKKIKDANIE